MDGSIFNDLPPEARSAIIGAIVGAAATVLTAFVTSLTGILTDSRKNRHDITEDHRQRRAAVFADVVSIAEDLQFVVDDKEDPWTHEPAIMGPLHRALAMAQLYGGEDTVKAAEKLRMASNDLSQFSPQDAEENFEWSRKKLTETARAEIAP